MNILPNDEPPTTDHYNKNTHNDESQTSQVVFNTPSNNNTQTQSQQSSISSSQNDNIDDLNDIECDVNIIQTQTQTQSQSTNMDNDNNDKNKNSHQMIQSLIQTQTQTQTQSEEINASDEEDNDDNNILNNFLNSNTNVKRKRVNKHKNKLPIISISSSQSQINELSNRMHNVESSFERIEKVLQLLIDNNNIINNNKCKNVNDCNDDNKTNNYHNDNKFKINEQNELYSIPETCIPSQLSSQSNNNINEIKHNHYDENNHKKEDETNETNETNEFNTFISKIKKIISINFIDYLHQKDIYNINSMDRNTLTAASKKNAFEIKNNVFSEVNYIPKIPDQLLSQSLEDDIYSTDTIANNDINNQHIELARKEAIKSVNDTINNWNARIINHDQDIIDKLLRNVIDPTNNKHNMDEVNNINNSMSKLFEINKQGQILLDKHAISALPASNILSVNNTELNNLYDEIYNTLKYNIKADNKIADPNKRIKNGTQILNVPRLNKLHISKINRIIGNVGNRYLLYPDDEETLHKFGTLITISNLENNHKLHWQLINIPFKQILTLQCIRHIIYKINIQCNTHHNINTIKKQNINHQKSQLSALATTICKARYPNDNKKDPFWVTNKTQWHFCSIILNKARKLYVALGALNRDLCKYAFGKNIISRTNWKTQSFQIVGDIEGKRKKKLCSKANNLKRAYENKLSENIIIEHFLSVIELYDQLQNYIINSEDVNNFCKSLYFKNVFEYNENLLAMYKKAEIAVITAKNSTSTFNLNIMSLKRDLLRWITVIKHISNEPEAKQVVNGLQGDVKILNLISCGELRGSEQRKETITNRLIFKYKDGPNTKRRKLNKISDSTKSNSFSSAKHINDDVDDSATPDIINQLFDNGSIFNTDNNKVNNWRIKQIKDMINTFEKEDINPQYHTNNNNNNTNNKNRKRSYTQMNQFNNNNNDYYNNNYNNNYDLNNRYNNNIEPGNNNYNNYNHNHNRNRNFNRNNNNNNNNNNRHNRNRNNNNDYNNRNNNNRNTNFHFQTPYKQRLK